MRNLVQTDKSHYEILQRKILEFLRFKVVSKGDNGSLSKECQLRRMQEQNLLL